MYKTLFELKVSCEVLEFRLVVSGVLLSIVEMKRSQKQLYQWRK